MDEKPLPDWLDDDEVDFSLNPPPLTEEMKRELDARLEHHRRNPDEPTFTLAEIRRKLLGPSR